MQGARKAIRASIIAGKVALLERNEAGIFSSPLQLLLLNLEGGSRQTSVDRCGLKLNIQNQRVVQEFLHVHWNRNPGNVLVARELDFDGNVQHGVIISVGVKGNGDKEGGRGIEKYIHSRKMLHQSGRIRGKR